MKSVLAITTLLLLSASGAAAPAWVPTDRWEPEVQTWEEQDRLNPPKPGGVLFIGSSSIRLWHTLAEDFPGVDVLNRGFGGSEIADSTELAQRIVVPYRPRMILLYAGDNDLANRRTPRQVREDFSAFVTRVRKDLPDIRIAFIAIKPSLARAHLLDKMREANALVREYAASRRGVAFIDVFTPMMTPDGKVRGELFVEDGLHLNRAGYELWKAVIAPYLR
ncbi:MAG TPA: SGNH/GDSL hydrolase family protein [Burkholderiales bacterium]